MAAFEPDGFFVLRTPHLPFSQLVEWADGSPLDKALPLAARQLTWLRRRSQAADVMNALRLASPATYRAAHESRDSAQAQTDRPTKLDLTLARYVARMAARPTPFGLFAGFTTGRITDVTALGVSVASACRLHARVDFEYLARIATALAAAPDVRDTVTYRCNSSLYKTAGAWRYARAEVRGTDRIYRLMSLQPDPYVDAVIARAGTGASRPELVGVIRQLDDAVTDEEARIFVDTIIAAEIITSDFEPTVTGADAVAQLLSKVQPHHASSDHVRAIGELARLVEACSAGGLDRFGESYAAVEKAASRLFAEGKPGRIIHVDMARPGAPTLGTDVVGRIADGIRALHAFAPPPADLFGGFRRAFEARYGSATVPFTDALDEESGIGFRRAPGAEIPDLDILRGLRFDGSGGGENSTSSARDIVLLRKLEHAWRHGLPAIEVTEEDLASLPAPTPLPSAIAAVCSVGLREDGGHSVFVRSVHGASGARSLGRFAGHDPELLRHVREHLRKEEDTDPDSVFAELVHVPQSRLGNVQARPHLREYEIQYLGRSGAGARTLPLSDLRIRVIDGRLELSSASLRKTVIPRMTSACNTTIGPTIFQFLAALHRQDALDSVEWSWGMLRRCDVLPRVVFKDVVVSRAQWRWSGAFIGRLKTSHSEAAALVRAWRDSFAAPRWVLLSEGENDLLIDLDNTVSVAMLVDLTAGLPEATLVEILPPPSELAATSPEGRYISEIVVPFSESPAARPPRRATSLPPAVGDSSGIERTLYPGGDWLFLKIYTSPSGIDRLLSGVVAAMVEELRIAAGVSTWFFVRYGDPHWHLRLRLKLTRPSDSARVLAGLRVRLAPYVLDGDVWSLELGTYQRELERYGGPGTIELVERVFEADSDAALVVSAAMAAGDRWQACAAAFEGCLRAAGYDGVSKSAIYDAALVRAGGLLKRHKANRIVLGERYRKVRSTLDRLVHAPPALPDAVIAALSAREAILAEQLEAVSAKLTIGSMDEIVHSLLHMTANRFLRSGARQQELVLYEFLRRHHESAEARSRRTTTL